MSNPMPTWQPQRQDVNPYAAPKVQRSVRIPGSRDPLGGRITRFFASLIDGIIHIPAIVVMGLSVAISPDEFTLWYFVGWAWILFMAIVQVLLLAKYSATVGKLMLSLYVADFETGEPAGWVKTIILRAMVGTLIAYIPYLGGLYSIIDALFIFRPDKRCIHDFIANTVVLKHS